MNPSFSGKHVLFRKKSLAYIVNCCS